MSKGVDRNLMLTSDIYIKQKEYWVNKLSGDLVKTELLTGRAPGHECRRDKVDIHIDGELFAALMKLSKRTELSLYLILLTCLDILIHFYTGNEDMIVLSPLYRENISEDMLNNYLFLRQGNVGNSTFKELLLEVRQTVFDAYENQDYPYDDLIDFLYNSGRIRDNEFRSNVECILLNIHNYDDADYEEIDDQLVFLFSLEESRLDGSILFSPDIYNPFYLEQLAGHFTGILGCVLENIDIKIPDIAFLSPAEKERLIHRFNSTGERYDKAETVHQRFEQQVACTPDRIAAVHKDRCLSYRGLDERAARMAQLLRERGVAPGRIVGIMMPPSMDTVAGILGILKAGGAYLPIDPDYPRDRIDYMLKDSSAGLLLKSETIPNDQNNAAAPTVSNFECRASDFNPSNLAYIIYTSGSTGKPKGVAVEHGNVMATLQWFGETYGIGTGRRVLQATNISFDVSVEEILGTLIFGATLFIPGRETLLDKAELLPYIEKQQIHIVQFVPVLLKYMFAEGKRIDCLDVVICGGEKLDDALKDAVIAKGYNLYNHYGPTEVTVDAAVSRCDGSKVVIGKPVSNAFALILDKNHRLRPVGIPGELCIGGGGLARGYLNNPGLTAEKFVSLPFFNHPLGSTVYRTGDLARWLPRGDIEFLGRIDHQVKIRGYRIELEEIESVLKSYPPVEDAVVVLKNTPVSANTELSAISLNAADAFIEKIKKRSPGKIKQYLEENNYRLTLEITNEGFIKTPRDNQRNWLIQRLKNEIEDDLAHLDALTGRFVEGSQREEITGDWKTGEAIYDDSTLTIEGQQVMQDWERPLMKRMAEIASESHGDVLEVGFGMGISATYLVEMGVRSYTVIECNDDVAAKFETWRTQYPHVETRLIHGKWQDVEDRLGMYDVVFFDTYPLDEEEYVEYVVNSITFAEDFFPMAARHLREGGVFTYYTNEIDSFSRRHQRLVLNHFDALTLEVVHPLYPPPDCDYWWADSMAAVKAVKRRSVTAPEASPGSTGTGAAENFRLDLEILNHGFIDTPRDNQRNWLIQRLKNEYEDDLIHLDTLTRRFVEGSQREEITGDWKTGEAVYDDSTLTIEGQQVMQDWERPLMKRMAEIASESHGDVLEVGFGMGISATYLVEMGVRSYTVIECNDDVAAKFETWRTQYPDVETRLIHGKWQDVEDRLGMYDAVFFDTYPLDEEEYVEYVVNSITFAEDFFPMAARHLREGGVFTYYTNEIDSFSRRHQRLVLNHFHTLALEVVKPLYPPPDCDYWWADSMAVVKAEKHPSAPGTTGLSLPAEIDTGIRLKGLSPGMRKAMARHLGLKVPGYEIDKTLVAYPVMKEGTEPDTADLRRFLEKKLPAYMIPSYFMPIDKIPLTPNGKIDTNVLPEAFSETGRDSYAAPENETEETLVEIWREVLNKTGDTALGIDDDFFELGGHSLKAIVMVAKVHKVLDVKLPLAEIFKTHTIRGLARYIDGASEETFTGLETPEKKEYYALSSAQKRLYVLQLMAPEATGYNVHQTVVVEGPLDGEKFEDTFRRLIRRHESLRTSFRLVNSEPVQEIHPGDNFEMEFHDLSETPGGDPASMENELVETFVRPFDLSEAPLLRVRLVKKSETEHILMADMHHIVTDGTSMGLFLNEFTALYTGRELPDLKFQYKDYAEWQNRQRQKETVKQQEEYWVEQLRGEVPVLELPIDFSRPETRSFDGGSVAFGLSDDLTAGVNRLASENGMTQYMVLLAAFTVFLSKLGNREDIIVGTPTAGRRHADLERIVGMFVNTLVMRNYPEGGKSAREFLLDVKKRTLEAFENQEFQFEDLVERAAVNRDPGRNPLFDVSFAAAGVDDPGEETPTGETPQLRVRPYKKEGRTAQFDLAVTARESGGILYFTFNYCTRLFKRETVQRFTRYFANTLSAVTHGMETPLSQIEILPPEEKKQLLYDFNDTAADFPGDKTIHRLFEEQVEKTPRLTAVIAGDETLTYGELNEKSNRLAHYLRAKGVGTGAIVGIMAERSPGRIIGIMAILKAGGAYLPVEPGHPRERIRYTLEDSGTKLLLTPEPPDPGLREICETVDPAAAPASNGKNKNPVFTGGSGDLAYVIYTSGSTGSPRGVAVEHRALVNRLNWMQNKYPIREGDILLHKTPFTFDVSVWELFWWAVQGAGVYLLAPGGEKDPGLIARAVEQYNVTVVHFVPSMLNAFLEYIDFPSGPGKLSSLKQVLCSGEALTPNQVKRFNEGLGKTNTTRLANLYGPTEATIDVSYYDCPAGTGIDTVPIGKPIDNIKLLVVNKDCNLQPVGAAGELCISGVGLARGYLNRPGLTRDKFIPHPFAPGERMYLTGDVARFMPDGDIEFLGRIDHQVKIRGNRIEPGEIENRLLKKEEIKEAVVIDREEENGDKYLCAYIVSHRTFTETELRDCLSRSLPGYMIPSYFVEMESIPLTPSGKTDRKALPVPGGKRDGEYTAPRNNIEIKLLEIWQHVLLPSIPIGIDDNFFRSGGHSLKATAMAARIHKAFHVKIPLAKIFNIPTIRGLAEYIKRAAEDKYAAIGPVEKMEYYPLSSAQERLYILQRMEPGGTAYNMPQFIPLSHDADPGKLETAFRKLIQRHESLRTSFRMVAGEPVQEVHDTIPFAVDFYETPEPFVRPFDPASPPLLRVGFLAAAEGNLLMVDMHHIVSDGISNRLLITDFMALYEGKELLPLRIHYKDFAQWQNNEKENKKLQQAYWLREFDGEVPVLDIPTDYPRPAIQRFEGNSFAVEIEPDLTGSLRQKAGEEGVTLYMLLLAAANLWLSRLGGGEDIILGTPIAGRRHADLEKIIGMFVNTLALRNFPQPGKTVREFLAHVKERTLDAFENQEYPFEDLVDNIAVKRDAGRNPLFDVMFVVQTEDIDGGLTGTPALNPAPENMDKKGEGDDTAPYGHRISKFDMTLSVVESGPRLKVIFTYSISLFKTNTVNRFSRYFENILSAVIHDMDTPLSHIEILPPEEKKQLLYDFNDTDTPYPSHKTLHGLVEERAEKTPGRTAVVFKHRCITFGELDAAAGRWARVLAGKGNGTGSLVALMTEPSIEMIAGIMAILKTGGAYLPIDPAYPDDRIAFMLADSGVKMLMTSRGPAGNSKSIKGWDGETYFLEEQPSKDVESHPPLAPGPVTGNRRPGLAYIIYTSGTTGRPRGVMIEHAGVVNTLVCRKEEYRMDGDCISLQLFSYAFDGFITSFFTPAVSGGKVILLSGDEVKNVAKIKDAIVRHRVTHFISIPILFQVIIESLKKAEAASLRIVTLAGDKVSPQVVGMARQKNKNIEISNEYGVTESSVMSTIHRHQEKNDIVHVGKPARNNRVFILDNSGRPRPTGCWGELCLAGAGLARGYLNNPGLTADKFPGVSGGPVSPAARKLYRTGDLARWLEDGSIDFAGRIDHQVKIRGYRIEPGEIENQLLKKDEIKETVVIDIEGENGDRYLCAYIVGTRRGIETAALKNHLARSLPDYMVPAYFVEIEKIPLTPNGKIDRKALPAPGVKSDTPYAAPRDRVEEKLAAIWADVLGRKTPVGIDDNFFESGGHSLKATTMVSRIQNEMEVALPLVDVFRFPTIRALAKYIDVLALGAAAAKDENLVLLKPVNRSAPHLFFIHDVSGQVDGYIGLCRYLKTGLNCWGLRADRLENHTPVDVNVKDIAAKYIQKIKIVQPSGNGPYYIAGWSLGGSIAIEIARQLEKENEKIAFLGLIDSEAPSPLRGAANRLAPAKFRLGTERRFLMNIFLGDRKVEEKAREIKTLDRLWPEIADLLETGGFDKWAVKRKLRNFGGHVLPDNPRLKVRDYIDYLNRARTLAKAVRGYCLAGKIKAPLYLFKASQSLSVKAKQWKKYLSTPLKLDEIEGSHVSILRSPRVARLAESFDHRLREA